MVKYFTLLFFFLVAFYQSGPLLKFDFFKKKIIICHLVIKLLASLFVVLFFFVELSRSRIPGNSLVKLTMVAL
jgi:hypothetical protein